MIGVGAVRHGRSIGHVNVHRLVEVPHKARLKPEPCVQKVEDRRRTVVVAQVAGIEMEGAGGGQRGAAAEEESHADARKDDGRETAVHL